MKSSLAKVTASVNLDFRPSFYVAQLPSYHAQGEEITVRKGQAEELFLLCAQIMHRPWDTGDQEVTAEVQTPLWCSFLPDLGHWFIKIMRVYLAFLPIVLSKTDTCLGQQRNSSNISMLLILPVFGCVDKTVGNQQRPSGTIYSPLQSSSSAVFQLHSCSLSLGTRLQKCTVFKSPCPIQLPSRHRNNHFCPRTFLAEVSERVIIPTQYFAQPHVIKYTELMLAC